MIDVVQHAIDVPERDKDEQTKTYIVSKLIPALRAGLKKHDCVEEHRGQSYFYGSMLIACGGELHELEGNFQLVEPERGYAAIGSGAEPALGSLRSTRSLSARVRVVKALETSAENNAGVAAPFDILLIKS